MSSKEIYEDLILQYQKLTLEEKKAILVYKSKLYLILNPMTNIPGFLQMPEEELLERLDKKRITKIFEEEKEIIFLPKNMVIRKMIFSSIDFSSIYTCMHSLKIVYLKLQQAHGKITLPADITVYRGISTQKGEKIDRICLSKILSTGLSSEDIESFLFQKEENHVFVITMRKGSSVLVTPYSLVSTYGEDECPVTCYLKGIPMTNLKIVKNHKDCQKELIFFYNDFLFEEKFSKVCKITEDEDEDEEEIEEEDVKVGSFEVIIHKIDSISKQMQDKSTFFYKKTSN